MFIAKDLFIEPVRVSLVCVNNTQVLVLINWNDAFFLTEICFYQLTEQQSG